jgi:hypothetical protein
MAPMVRIRGINWVDGMFDIIYSGFGDLNFIIITSSLKVSGFPRRCDTVHGAWIRRNLGVHHVSNVSTPSGGLAEGSDALGQVWISWGR